MTKRTVTTEKQRIGFALWSPEKRREVASQGGKAGHAQGKAHKWTSQEAQEAGRKGGTISRRGHAKTQRGEERRR